MAILLSIPATVAAIGLFLTAIPPTPTLTLPFLLMFFPLWVSIACASYLPSKTSTAAVILIMVFITGMGLIALLKFTGTAGI